MSIWIRLTRRFAGFYNSPMKKLPVLVLLLLILASPLFSYAIERNHRLMFGTGNDMYSTGLSKNYDDFLTFNTYTQYHNGPLKIRLYFNGYTDRRAGTREDELILNGLWSFNLVETGRFRVGTSVSAGINVFGNLGLEWIQNEFRSLAGEEPVNLTYSEEYTFKPYVEAIANTSYDIKYNFRLGLQLKLRYHDDFIFDSQVALWYNQSMFGFTYAGNWTDQGYIGAWGTRTRLDLGLVIFDHEMNLNSKIGFGSIAIDVMSFTRDRIWQNSDTHLRMGVGFLQGYRFIVQQSEIKIPGWAVHATINSRYTVGYPQFNTSGPDKMPCTNNSQMSGGIGYKFPTLWIFTPFAELVGGLATWQNEFVDYNTGESEILEALKTPFVMLRAGTEIIPEGFIVCEAATMTLFAAAELNYFFKADQITEYVRKDGHHTDDYTFNALSVSFSFGVAFGLDLY